MKAVGFQKSLPITERESLLDIELPDPVPEPRDLLVEVKAVSVNPVDTKMRMRGVPVTSRTGTRTIHAPAVQGAGWAAGARSLAPL